MGLSGIKETPKTKHPEASLVISISNVLSLKMPVLVSYWERGRARGKGGGVGDSGRRQRELGL